MAEQQYSMMDECQRCGKEGDIGLFIQVEVPYGRLTVCFSCKLPDEKYWSNCD